jgi:hypothetical protein
MDICDENFDLYEPTYYTYGFEFCNLMAVFSMIAIGHKTEFCWNRVSPRKG